MGQWKRPLFAVVVAAGTALSLVAAAPMAQAVQAAHDRVVSAVPGENSPNIQDGATHTIVEIGNKVILGGNFTKVANRGTGQPIVTRNRILAYDRISGLLDTSFVPTVDGDVETAIPGPTANTVLIGGKFNNVNGTARKSVALLNTTNGALVTSFVPPAFNGLVNRAVLRGNRLFLGGTFTKVASQNHAGLAALNATTGAVDNFVQIQIAGHHNYNGTGAQAAVQVDSFDVTPDASQLVMIGNFKTVNGLPRDQIAVLDLTGASAVVRSNWNTLRYTPACARGAFDSYMRDVDLSPDGSYFVVVATGAHFGGTLCDTASRWNLADSGSDVQPRWIDDAGGDTLLSVAITGTAVYVGGHPRWMNNPNGADSPGAGAVARPGLAALDPVSGLPFTWNPGRNPRGAGAAALHASANGLYVGSDTIWIGNHKYKRGKIAFFPVNGGAVPPPTTTPQLPAKVYQGSLTSRTYNGTTAGAPVGVPNPDGTNWALTRGAFMVGGTLFYGRTDQTFVKRSFNGTTFGSVATVDPYHDPLWDNVATGSGPAGQTYRGTTVGYYAELPNVTGAFFDGGRLYYSLSGQSGLFYRLFNPESGIIGGTKFTVSGATGFTNTSGLFLSGGNLYRADQSNGNLLRMSFAGGVVGGSTLVSGPGVDGANWQNMRFLAP